MLENRVTVKTVSQTPERFGGANITVAGWVRSIRDSKGIAFIELNDGSCFESLQIVIDAALENFSDIVKQNQAAALICTGTLALTPEGRQPYELRAEKVTVEGTSTPDYPLQKKRHTLEYLRTMPHLRARTNTLGAMFRLRSTVSFAIHKFFAERDFVYVQTPIITGSDCEGAGEMFQVTTMPLEDIPKTPSGAPDFSEDFFGKQASLTVSGQLEAEAFALCYDKVYTFGPTFRAENSNTNRHAAEFWMIEPEIAFADLSDDIQLIEDMLKYVVSYSLEHCRTELEFFAKHYDAGITERLQRLVSTRFEVCDYTAAIDILQKSGQAFAFKPYWGCDIQTEHERYLAETHFNAPVFIINYPKEIKSFYMRLNDDGKTVAATDLLVPGVGEIIGGSQREERLDVLEERMLECGLNPADYEWYKDLRRYGGTRHAGFGLGLERLLLYMTSVGNIRDVLLYPRTPGTLA